MNKMRSLILAVAVIFFLFPVLHTPVFSVNSQVVFSPIQDLINTVPEGSTIYVPYGTYDGVLKINKSLTMIGLGAVIKASGCQVAVIISASNVTFTGFTVQNAIRYGNGSIPDELSELWISPQMEGAAIYVYFARNVTIANVRVNQSYMGIGITHSTTVYVSDCTVSGNTWGIATDQSLGVRVSTSVLTNNYDLQNNGGGAVWAGQNTILFLTNSTVLNNLWGVVVQPTANCGVYYNNFINNGTCHNVYIHPSAGCVGSFDYNYWNDYNGTEGTIPGVGSTPYIIDANNQDNFPLLTDPPLTSPPGSPHRGGGSFCMPRML